MENTTFQKISFIVATVDRDKQLQECIVSIEKAHEYKRDIPIEILVVIQKTKQKKDIRILYHDITKFYYIDKIGLSAARNFGIEKSTGDYFVFLDDDASVNEDFIDVLSRRIIAHRRVNAFCGRLIDPIQQVPFSRLFCNNNVKNLRRFDYQYFMGSAHILSREVIRKIGCYDERFGVGAKYFGSEETDIFFRLKAAGEQVLYLPDLVFFHYLPTVPASYVFNYAYAIGAVLTKNCISDKGYSIIYCCIVLQRIIKASIRILQRFFLRGRYIDKDKRYHYGSVLRGTFSGIKDFITNEL